jgi:O-acetyl-ADP-ribose deacetylase (regulator of RNase III)
MELKRGISYMITAIKGDITKVTDMEAIVNAANTSLLGGGGVDGAIHRAAGPELLAECRTLHGCETGEAKITGAYNLPCKYVIHTVGPIWQEGNHSEAELLANCYFNSLKVAAENGIHSVAFPSISTGVYRFPVERAAAIAVDTVFRFLRTYPNEIETVEWVLFDDHTFEVYQEAIDKKYS